MQDFRHFTQSVLGKVILVLITLPFVALGFLGYFNSGFGADQLATVGDATITKQQVSNKVQSTRQQLKQTRPNLNFALLNQLVTPEVVLKGMVSNVLLSQAAESANMVVSQKQVSGEIVAADAFQDAKGNFSTALFQQFVSSRGYTRKGFMQLLQTQQVRQQVQNGYELTAFALPGELQQQQRLAGQTRSIRYVNVSLKNLANDVSVTGDEVKAYYEAHKANYIRPAQIKLNWVEITPDTFDVSVTDEDIQREYEARKKVMLETAASTQERKVSDILVLVNDNRTEAEAKAQAEKLYQQLQQGADFAALAKANSDAILTAKKGGNMGWLMRSALPDALANVVFTLDKGQYTKPIKTKHGYHLMKVTGVKAKSIPSLDEMRADIKKDILKQKELSAVSHNSTKLGDMAYEHSGLSIPAENLGLTIQQGDWINPEQPSGLAAKVQVQKALGHQDVSSGKQNSRLLNLGNSRYVVIHVADKRDASQLAFEDVKELAKQQLIASKARQHLASLKQSVIDADSLKEAASTLKGSIQSVDGLTRRDSRVPRSIVKQVFELAPTKSTTPVLLQDLQGNLWAVTLESVASGSPLADNNQLQPLLARMGMLNGRKSVSAVLDWLHSETDIVIKQDKLKSMS